MIKAIALDDEPIALQILESYCQNISFIHLEKTFNKQSEALKYLNKYPIDLLFLDIQMPQKNGLDFYKSLNQETKLIFTTAFSEFAVEAFEMNAVDYLLKPFSFERFYKAVEKVHLNLASPSNYLSIRADYRLHQIELSTIKYIEALDDYVRIHLKDSTTITARQSLKNIEKSLPSSQFARVHRSFIVSISNVSQLTMKNLKVNDQTIPIGKKYKEDIIKLFS